MTRKKKRSERQVAGTCCVLERRESSTRTQLEFSQETSGRKNDEVALAGGS